MTTGWMGHPGMTPGMNPAMHGSIDLYGWVGVAVIVAVAVVYWRESQRRPRRGEGRINSATIFFVAGLVSIAVVIVVDVGGAEHHHSTHVARHMVLMMFTAPLLVVGEPLRVVLQNLPRRYQVTLLQIARDPAVRAFTAVRWSTMLITVDYYGSMAVYIFTPLQRWSMEHTSIGAAANFYFLACGIVFWTAILGKDPTGGRRPRRHEGIVLTLIGAPVQVVLGYGLMTTGQVAQGWVMAAGGALLSLAGAAGVALYLPSRRDDESAGVGQWHAAS